MDGKADRCAQIQGEYPSEYHQRQSIFDTMKLIDPMGPGLLDQEIALFIQGPIRDPLR